MPPAAPVAPTQSAQLFADGHAAALVERGELARGNPLPQIGGVQVDAVVSEVTDRDTAAYGGVYKKGDFKMSVSKSAFQSRPVKGQPVQMRGEKWTVNDPVIDLNAVYLLAVSRSLR